MGGRDRFSVTLWVMWCALYVSAEPQKRQFSCEGRAAGYYADVESGCQIYHMCDGLGRQFSYTCPNTTLFQQRMLICDHWYMVNCSKSEVDYSANLLIGQKGKPFVEDDEENPYHRTPRPDLLANPSSDEYNIIYRIGRAQQGTNKNLVGVDSRNKDDSGEPAYFLPSHWSTEYTKSTTEKTKAAAAKKEPKVNFKSNYKATTPVYPKIAPTREALNEYEQSLPKNEETHVNFKSNYKATTPVYPKIAPTREPLIDDEQSLPKNEETHVNFKSNFKATTPVYPKIAPTKQPLIGNDQQFARNDEETHVNFKSNYKATTPVYPKIAPTVEPLSFSENEQNPLRTILTAPKRVNFKSNFKATTPVYPTSVEPEEPLAEEEVEQESDGPYGLSSIVEPPKGPEAPRRNRVVFESTHKATTPVYPKFVPSEEPLAIEEAAIDPNQPGISTVIQPPKSYSENVRNTIIQKPSIYYEPPAAKESPAIRTRVSADKSLAELRRFFLIPDYVFPLDASAVRPNYNEGPSSFQVNPFAQGIMQRDHAYA
ncbi:PREDICTED: uncharacterized protein LOC108565779 isoform X2 [Nicrophorus vespilloides]|uniref:Uncharacterized protein LOC108565779 isoform X2 n=1 Tax=Nicrophorus vespilloides TaxID=110193 RepID=A0ABM1N232_NICVS|nr:PREDICTED: uncharacterized protein LOC108565779 isoform X2 [Nicrophorus vespilloides]